MGVSAPGNQGGHGEGDCLQEEQMDVSASDTPGVGDGEDEEAMNATVTVSHGGMARLLRQLRSLKATSIEGVTENDFQTFKANLERLCRKLKDLAEVESPSFTAKGWMEEVRNLCYDTEDYLDKVTQSGADVGESALIKAYHRGKPKRQRQFAADFSVLRARANGAEERYAILTTYSLPAQSIKPAPAELSVLDNNREDIHKHTDDLVELLDFDAPKQFKVVSILGFAGVGKTTLARSLYHKFGTRFEYCAFVRVSRNPDMRRLLISMLSQIKGEQAHVSSDVHDLFDNINEHLHEKRYLIVIDDLWVSMTWDIISRALPRDNGYSRIIITTQAEDVAMGCCSYDLRDVFKIRPSNYLQSCGEPFETTIMVDNLLRHNLTEAQPWYLQISLLSSLRTNPTSEGMKELLDHIYGSLPPHLKTCLLHFNMYPEDYTIKKGDLVKQWVAEGFIGEVNEQDRFKVAEGYFHELTRRGLIQEVYTNYNNDVLTCTVHHIVLDYIRYKSEEESFISIADYFQTTPGNPDRIRRLSVQFGGSKGAKIPGSVRMNQLRSLVYFGFFKCVPSVAEYVLLRVLILHVWADKDKTNFDLSSIQELFRLRYLKIACNVSVKLPTKIRWLQYLETLDIDAIVVNFPSDIVHLQHLLHLRLPREINMPRGIDKMTSLCSLAYFQLSRDNVLNLGKLANLQDLHLICYKVKSDRLVVIMKSLGSIMEKLSKLKTLVLDAGALTTGILCDGLSNVPSPPHHLQKLKFSPQICIFPSLPEWIGKLNELAILRIAVKDLPRNNIETLKRLTGLAVLSLSVQSTPAERVVFDQGFQALRYFKFTCTAACLSFVQGAMVKVERLKLCFNADTIEQNDLTSVGFQYLTSLQEISVKFGDPSSSSIRNAQTALDAAVSKHPNTPIVNVQSTEGISFGDKEKNVSPQITYNLQSPGRQSIITFKDSVELVVREKEGTTTAVEEEDQIKKEKDVIEGKDTDAQQGDQENISSEEDTYNQNNSRENPQTELASVVGKHPSVQSKEGISHGDKDKNVPVPKTNLQASDTQGIITDEDSDEHQTPGGTNLQAPKRLSTITQEDSSGLDSAAEKVTHKITQEPILEGHIPRGQGVTVQRATEGQQIEQKNILSEYTDNSRSSSPSPSKVISGLSRSNPETVLAAAVTVSVQSTEGISYGDKANNKLIQNTYPQASETPDIIADNDSDEQGYQEKDVSSTAPPKGKHQTLSEQEEHIRQNSREIKPSKSCTQNTAPPPPLPMTVGATVVSRIITTLLKKNLSHLGFDRSAEKLKELETKFVQLKLELETVESPHRYRSDELLPKLRSSFYEAEDILDDVEYYRLKRQILSQPDDKLKSGNIRHRRNWMKKLPSALPKLSCLKKQMSGTISSDAPTDISKRKLKKLLNNIENNINDAHKLKTVSTNSRSAVTTAAPPPVVIGRERDRDHIMAMLNLGEPQPASNDCDLSYSIIGIHGIFGSGKSTLAQYICASFRDMHYRFDLIMWVHVSQNFSVDDIFSKMLEEATGKPCPEFKCLNTLERRLKEELGAKRFLLVLDDVWFSKDDSLQKLQKIVSSLNVGYTRSKILVTSQTADALLALGAWRCIPIPDLNDSDFFQLFMHCALEGANIDKQDRRKFEVIGADIAKKLRRSPLAARTVGAQLRIRPNINFWRDACHRDLLNETIGALWSSYQHLDEQLWRCFAYCGIFPRGHRLQRNEIINMWVAQGFIKTTDASEDMEDVGERYFDELVSYSFLLPAEKLSGMLFDIESFTVNDLLHVVAEKVAGSECFRIEDGWSGECPKDVCHLFVQTYIGAQIIEKISKLENLRTLVIYTDNGDQLIDDNIFESIFIRLRKLRVLNVQSGSYESYHVFSVPASIGQLKRLRYFSFGFSQLTLPSTFSKLYHMQVLDFGTCGNVAFSSVEDMANLINLRHITLLQSHADFSFPNINRLTLLKTLPFYTVRKEQGYGIQQLEHLNKLRGRLQICGLENVQSKEEAVKAKLADKEGLTDLALYWDDDKCDPYVQPEVLEGLCPPRNIAKLTIGGYYGWTYPNWMVAEQNGPNYLEELELYRCDLEQPGHKLYNFFAHLRSLRLRGCSWPALPDFMQDLTELTDLIIDGCMNHQRFDLPALPQSLNYFQIENCNDDFMTSCTTIGHPNWEKVKGIPNLIIGNETIRHRNDNSEGLRRRVTSVRKHATIPNW